MTRLTNVISCMTRRHKSAVEIDHPSSNSAEDGGHTAEGEQPHMKACLTTFDLVSLGVGSCLGTGMYLTAGLVASTMSGPGGVVSLFFAGAASMLTGLCYAELAGLCPRTSGSAYMYAYITVGELVAFVIGWGLVVEYVIGTAAGAVALSETLDSLSDGLFATYAARIAGVMGLPKLDLMAAFICIMLTLLLASGAEMSAKVNNGLNITNVAVLLFFFIVSMVIGSAKNWRAGGFFPYGLTGVVRAIPTCYFAYIGFDTVAATGAEAQNPSKAVPRSILLSILFNCLAYVIVILALTYDLPFYKLPHDTAMTDVFSRLNFAPGKYIVAVGAVSGEFAATFGSMFPLPRVLAAMAEDGLIFRKIGKICPKRQTPVRATLLSGFVAMVMATFFNLSLLIELVLIGTLLAYVLVTFALLYVRYLPENPDSESENPVSQPGSAKEELSAAQRREDEDGTLDVEGREVIESEEHGSKGKFSSAYQRLPGLPRKQPNMGRSEFSSTSKRVTFTAPPNVQSDSSTQSKSSARNSTGVLGKLASSLKKKYSREKNYEDFRALLDSSSNSQKSTSEQNGTIDRAHLSSKLQKQEQKNVLSTNSQQAQGFESDDSDSSERNLHLYGLLNTTPNRGTSYSNFPLWVKIITDIVSSLTAKPSRILCLLGAVYIMEIMICVLVSKTWKSMADGSIVCLGLLGFLSAIFLVLVGIVSFLPQSRASDAFRAPLVPALPIFVAFINIYLMTSLSLMTWLLFGVWMAMGLLVYLLYGISHSQAGGATQTYIALPTMELTVVMDDSDDDEERSLLYD